MRRLIFVFAIWLASPAWAACEGENLIDALSEADRADLQTAVDAYAYPEGNFWRATKPGSTVTVVGTVHIPDPRLAPLIEHVTPALENADLLILEATKDAESEMQRIMTETPEVAFLTEGPTLIDLLGEEDWALVSERLQDRQVPPIIASRFRPWLIAVTLGVPGCAMSELMAGKAGFDGRLEDMARDAGTPIATLDDIEAIMNILDAGTLEEQVELLRVNLYLDYDEDALFATTLDSYFAGRHRELVEFSMSLMGPENQHMAEEFMTGLLDNRNAAWEPKIARLVEGKTAVLAVGAAHLSGETGVLRALERMGYTLEPF